jgi:hypothetical protein
LTGLLMGARKTNASTCFMVMGDSETLSFICEPIWWGCKGVAAY